MSALRNPKHEKFAKGLAEGLSAVEAYERAGFKRNRSAACRLQRDVNIGERVDELLQQADNVEKAALQQATERLSITKERVLGELAKIGFATMGSYLKATSGGDPFFDYASLDDDAKAAISEVTVEDFKEGRGEDARDVRKVKFKLHDKRAALVDLGRHLGLFPRQVELSGKGGGPIEHSHRRAEDMSDDELALIASGGGDGDPSET